MCPGKMQTGQSPSKPVAFLLLQGARISTADLYGFVSAKCGGQGYEECRGFQLPNNVHFTPEGWGELAAFMQKAYLEL